MSDEFASLIEDWKSQVARIDQELLEATQAINADAARRISEMYAAHAERRSRLFAAIAVGEISETTCMHPVRPQGNGTPGSRPEPAKSVILRMLAEASGDVRLRDVVGSVVAVGWTSSAAAKAVLRMEENGLLIKANRMVRLTPAGMIEARSRGPAQEKSSSEPVFEDRGDGDPGLVLQPSAEGAERTRRQRDEVFGKAHPLWDEVSNYAGDKVREGGVPLSAGRIATLIKERYPAFEVDGKSIPNRLLGMGFRRVFVHMSGKASYWIGDVTPKGYR